MVLKNLAFRFYVTSREAVPPTFKPEVFSECLESTDYSLYNQRWWLEPLKQMKLPREIQTNYSGSITVLDFNSSRI